MFVSSGRAEEYLRKRWPNSTWPVVGLASALRHNHVLPAQTLAQNVFRMVAGGGWNAVMMMKAMSYNPHVIISDFDPFSARHAMFTGTRLIAIDNIHFMNRCQHPPEIVNKDRAAAALMFPVVSEMVPFASRYFVTTFVDAPVRIEPTELHHPILRPKILRAKTTERANHVVGYFNDKADHALRISVLKQMPDIQFRLYGMRGVEREVRDGNVTLCPVGEELFISDLACARAVISGAGFTLMTEAIYLGIPMMATPYGGHFEQILNAEYLEHLGYGERACDFTVDGVRSFLARSPSYAKNMQAYQHDGNRALLTAVRDELRQ